MAEEREDVRNKFLGSLEFLAIKNVGTTRQHGAQCFGSKCFIYNIGIRGTHISILRLALFHVELGYFKLSVPFLLNGVSFNVSLSLYIYEKIKIST